MTHSFLHFFSKVQLDVVLQASKHMGRTAFQKKSRRKQASKKEKKKNKEKKGWGWAQGGVWSAALNRRWVNI